jgi:organic radical activating enzyme
MESIIKFFNKESGNLLPSPLYEYNESNKDTWCVNAEHAMSGNNTGTTKICCMYKNENLNYYLGKDPIIDNFYQKNFYRARKDLGTGIRHSHCSWCFEEEDAGRKSKRLRDNEKYLGLLAKGDKPYNGLSKVELNLGNTCNLKCRTCAPHSSSTWMQEYYDIYEKRSYNSFKSYAKEMKKYHQYYDEESPFWEDLENNLSTIRQFDFYGGEPFMSKKMWKVLEKAVELGYSKHMDIHYATNGTHWPEENIQIFKYFNHVHISFSIDGVDEGFTYMRYPADWNEVKSNMIKAREFNAKSSNLYLGWCITLSSLNIYSLPDILKENFKNFKDFGPYLNLVHGPIWYNLTQLPEHVKIKVIERLKSISPEETDYNTYNYHLPGVINYIKQGVPYPKNWEKFLEYTKIHDEYRGQSFSQIYKEYSKIIGI